MEKNDAYNDAAVEMKVQIKQVEALIEELQLSIRGSTTVFKSLYVQVSHYDHHINRYNANPLANHVFTLGSQWVNRLERTYNKNCGSCAATERRPQELFNPNIGFCAHTGIIKVSKPIVSHLNAHLNSGYTYGSFGKDSKPVPDRESMYWYSGYTSSSIVYIRFYTHYKNLILRNQFQHHNLHSSWIGSGNNFIICDNTLYYQINSPFGLAKLNFTTTDSEKN
ncbi:hypothetical protein FQN60_009007, partial [Etheostoma spectabile]